MNIASIHSLFKNILYSGAIATTAAISLLAPSLSKPAEANLENSYITL